MSAWIRDPTPFRALKVAVLSDTHANLPAVEAVVGEIAEGEFEETWFLGDAVGYVASPNEVVEILFERCDVLLTGNHDLAALGELDVSTFSPNAAEAALWTRDRLTDTSREALAGLPGPSALREGIGLFHASPRDPVWEYVLDPGTAGDCMDESGSRIGLIGHSHVALWFTRRDEMSRVAADGAPGGTEIDTSIGSWLVNPGSVGQPRDGDPRAAWIELDTETFTVRYRRTPYEIARAAEAILEAGLPPNLADRLGRGT